LPDVGIHITSALASLLLEVCAHSGLAAIEVAGEPVCAAGAACSTTPGLD
jgi:hypothetical protein